MRPKFTIAPSPDFASELSWSSSPPCSSEYTTTSSSTIWGPGALLGKFLLAFGKALLHVGEYVVIRRRLSAIKSAFPHHDNSQVKNLDKLYEDILEVMRSVFRIRCCVVQSAKRNT